MNRYFILIAALVTLSSAILVHQVGANPSQILTKETASASSTVTYMTSGNATTTLTYDTQEDGGLPMDSAILAVNFSGSSTLAVLNIDIEYSHDGVGWYRDNTLFDNGISTTTPSLNISAPNAYTWTFASSTVNGRAVNATSGATSTKAITLKTPTRYIRTVFSVSGANAAIWAQIIGKKQNR